MMDGFPDELREVVNDHWGQFPQVHPLVNQLFGLFYLMVTLLCTFSSLFIVYVFATSPELRIPVTKLHNTGLPKFENMGL